MDKLSDGFCEGFSTLFQLFSQIRTNGDAGYRSFGVGVFMRDILSK